MKKGISLVLFLVMALAFIGCKNSSGEDPTIKETASIPVAEPLPGDFQVVQENARFYDSLNLDGVGNYDDKLYISLYRWCNDAAVIVLQIKLGTGETIAEVIPSDGYFDDLYFGHLFSLEKDAVVVQVGVPNSNYGSSKVYVYNVYGAGEVEPAPSIVEKFDCAGSDIFAPTIDADFPKDDIVIMGTEITEVEGHSLQGIRLGLSNHNALDDNFETIVYWKENGWTAIK